MRCQACGAEIPDETYNICPECGQNPGSGEEGENAYVGVERDQPVFENWREIGLPNALFETCKAVLLEPSSTFSRMKLTGYENPIIFMSIVVSIGAFVAAIWNLVFRGAMMSLLPNSNHGAGALLVGGVIGIPIAVIIWIVLGLVVVFLGGGISHLILKALKGDSQEFEATARVYAYSMASYVFMVIPFIGGLVGLVWFAIALVIGLREVHKADIGKALVAALAPIFICCGSCVVIPFALAFLGAVGSAAAGAGTTP